MFLLFVGKSLLTTVSVGVRKVENGLRAALIHVLHATGASLRPVSPASMFGTNVYFPCRGAADAAVRPTSLRGHLVIDGTAGPFQMGFAGT